MTDFDIHGSDLLDFSSQLLVLICYHSYVMLDALNILSKLVVVLAHLNVLAFQNFNLSS